jgi:inosine-uridine nucleoside N-ribohydrolase
VKVPVILDTDIGMDVDDAIALSYAALDPRIDLRAVTTVNGDTQTRASVARALLRLAGRPDIPVGAGARNPIDGRENALMPRDHVDTDAAQSIEVEEHPSAHDVLRAVLEATTEPITICTIGPLTNIASFFTEHPELLDGVARIQMMGGCLERYQVNGVEWPPYEFNVGCDPTSTSIVLALPVPIGLVPIEVTVQAFLTDAQRAAIRGSGRLGEVLDKLMDNFIDLLSQLYPQASKRVFLHDPLTLATLVHDGVATFESCTVAGFGPPGAYRTLRSPHGRLLDQCTSVDNDALGALLVDTLSRVPAIGAPHRRPRTYDAR